MDTIEHNYPRVAGRATLFALLMVIAGLVWLFFFATDEDDVSKVNAAGMKLEPLTLVTASGPHALRVEVARTPQEQALGLMYRTELANGQGMLFVHERPQDVAMWMKNTYIPLDMVFIKRDGTVHRIARKTEPHSEALIHSEGEVNAVLEIAGGAAKAYGLEPGDKVRHQFFARK